MAPFPSIGDSFGRYDITGRLGQGGMGVVYAAVHRDLQRPVALKLLSADLADDASYRQRFLREAQILARIDSPHVVRVHDAGEHDGNLFIAAELVTGGDLEQVLGRDGPFGPDDAVDLLGQVARGISVAHRLGVLHRDIKPSNVLLKQEDDGGTRAIVCDFGIAKAEDSSYTNTRGVIGTWGYLAPERHEGADATVASDVYALGCLMWALLTGEPPYGGTAGQIVIGHLQHPVRQLPPGALGATQLNPLLARAMAKQPADRPASVDALLAELAAIGPVAAPQATAPPVAAPPATAPPVPVRVTAPQAPPPTALAPAPEQPRRSRRPLLIGAIVLAVAATTTVGVVLAGGGDGGDGGSGGPVDSDAQVCLVASGSGFDDASYNQAALAGFERVVADLGAGSSTFVASGNAPGQAFQDAVDAGCNQVSAFGIFFAEESRAAADRHPDVQFTVLDHDYRTGVVVENLETFEFDVIPAALVAGYLAAAMSETGIVGTFGGEQTIQVEDFMDGFRQGVELHNAEQGEAVQLLGWDGTTGKFTGDFGDPESAFRAADKLSDAGADVIFPVAGPASSGALRFAAEEGIYAISPDFDGCTVSPEHCDAVLTSVLKNFDVGVELAVRDFLEDGIGSEGGVGTLENDAVALGDVNAAVPEDVRALVEEVRARLERGEIQVAGVPGRVEPS